jgi:hypothetical protein
MSCRTNLKKEKRMRNRVNAFRFKKGGFSKNRFRAGPDYGAIQRKADEDAKYYSLVRRLHARHAACSRTLWPCAALLVAHACAPSGGDEWSARDAASAVACRIP